MVTTIKRYIQKETILVISGILAVCSCLITPPSAAYAGYINFRVLILLFCLMAVVAGMQEAGFFHWLSSVLIDRVHTIGGIATILTLLCFGLSMFLTNDVTLITLVPFTLLVFRELPGQNRNLLTTLVLETVAANLGSMLTPIGNPQNLYLYSEYHFSMIRFIEIMLPYTAASLALILIALFLLFPQEVYADTEGSAARVPEEPEAPLMFDQRAFAFYLILFVVCLFSVARILDYRILFAVTIVMVLIRDRRILGQVNYSLLLTFIFFFVFIGNIGSNALAAHFLRTVIAHRETLTAVLASQVVSNVPAALLLSGFTSNGTALVIGTNLGGLGTLIASMASLITYQFYAEEHPDMKGTYLAHFTVVNLVFLAVLYGIYLLLM